jgi:predicted MFS family arabinose efflux permease
MSGQVVEVAGRALGVSASSSTALRFGVLFMAALAAAGSLPYFFLREPPRLPDTRRETPPVGRVARLFAQLLVPDVIIAFGMGAILTFVQLYFHLRFRLDPGLIGLIMGLGGLIAGVGTLAVPLLASRWGSLRTAVRLQWLAVPAMAALALSTQLGVAIPVYWLVVTLRGMIDPVYTAFIQERVPEVYRGRLTGFYSVTYSIGYSLGPGASGAIQKIGGFTPAFLMGAGCYFMGASLLYTFFGWRGRSAISEAGEERLLARGDVP